MKELNDATIQLTNNEKTMDCFFYLGEKILTIERFERILPEAYRVFRQIAGDLSEVSTVKLSEYLTFQVNTNLTGADYAGLCFVVGHFLGGHLSEEDALHQRMSIITIMQQISRVKTEIFMRTRQQAFSSIIRNVNNSRLSPALVEEMSYVVAFLSLGEMVSLDF